MESPKSYKGSFLIASPRLGDPNFTRTVVFMVEHNAEGAFGLVLSRPTPVTFDRLYDHIFDDAADTSVRNLLSDFPVYTGGPVQGSAVFFLHTLEAVGTESVQPGLYLGSQAADLEQLIARLGDDDPPKMRVFTGYSGWAPQQLEREIDEGGWLIRTATIEQVFEVSHDKLCGELLGSFGGDLGILGRLPSDPEMN